jgi:hypothetical protein
VVEQQALADLLAGAVSGRGYRGPSTDPVVLARRLVESERVRVDMPGRLSVDEVADLALRCGRAMRRVSELETLVATLEAALDQQAGETRTALAEAEVVRERVVVLARDLRLATEARERIEDSLHSALAWQPSPCCEHATTDPFEAAS